MIANSAAWRSVQVGQAIPDSRKPAGSLTSAAQQFESMLLGQWLADAESSFGSAPGGDDDRDSGGEQMKDFGVRQLAGQLTAAGGIGIARMVEAGLLKGGGQASGGDGPPEASRAAAGAQRAASTALAYGGEIAR